MEVFKEMIHIPFGLPLLIHKDNNSCILLAELLKYVLKN